MGVSNQVIEVREVSAKYDLQTAKSGVPVGYKQTEVGVIPEDWDITPFPLIGNVIDGDRGANYPGSNDFNVDGYCLFLNAGNVTKSGFRFSECAFITQEKDERLSKGKLQRDDIVLTTRGTVGNFAHFDATIPFHHIRINSGMVILRRASADIDPYFLYLLLQSNLVTQQIERLTFGSAQPQLTVKGVSSFEIIIPPLPEQLAIATALNDMNALLDGLDQLITKKRDLKQAAMQQLLTGQTRLPGFEGEWDVKLLADIAHIKTGSRNNEDKIEDGDYPFFVRSEIVERIDSYSHDCEAILVPGEGRIGDIFHYIQGRFDVHQRVYAITQFKPNVSAKFVHLYMKMNFGEWAMQNTVKATVDSLRLPTFQTFQLTLPLTREEQTAIATILSEMDAEIESLEKRRHKTRDLKQAMMQELLTGRTRLV